MPTLNFGPNSRTTDSEIEQAFGNSRQVGAVVRSAQGQYYSTKNPFAPGIAQGQSVFDTSSMTAKIVLQEVFGLQRPFLNLDQLVTPKPMNSLVTSFYVATQSSAHRKLAKGQEPDVNMNQYARVDMRLWLNASHVLEFDEDQLQSDIPIYAVSKNDAAMALAYAQNQDIADEIANCSAITGANWATMTTAPTSDHDPLSDIAAAYVALTAGLKGVATTAANAGVMSTPSILAMHPNVWKAFITNSFITRYLLSQQITVPSPGAVGTGTLALPMYPNMKIVVNGLLPSTIAYLIDPSLFILGTGPKMAVGYRNDLKRLDGYAMFEYLQPKLVQDQSATLSLGVRSLTGVAT